MPRKKKNKARIGYEMFWLGILLREARGGLTGPVVWVDLKEVREQDLQISRNITGKEWQGSFYL